MAAVVNSSSLAWVPSSRRPKRPSGSSARVVAPQCVARTEFMGASVHRQGALCYIGAMPAQKVKVRPFAAKRPAYGGLSKLHDSHAPRASRALV